MTPSCDTFYFIPANAGALFALALTYQTMDGD
jgi:hypothetical protein